MIVVAQRKEEEEALLQEGPDLVHGVQIWAKRGLMHYLDVVLVKVDTWKIGAAAAIVCTAVSMPMDLSFLHT